LSGPLTTALTKGVPAVERHETIPATAQLTLPATDLDPERVPH
jgi:hypothetical protein